MEQLRNFSDLDRTALQEGVRLTGERQNFDIKTAVATQKNCYQDMSFHVTQQPRAASLGAADISFQEPADGRKKITFAAPGGFG